MKIREMPWCPRNHCEYFEGHKENVPISFERTPYACAAFPDRIPDDILDGKILHLKPMFGQKNRVIYRTSKLAIDENWELDPRLKKKR